MQFREISLGRDANCPACGEKPTITELVDYDTFCGLPGKEKEATMISEIDPVDLKKKMDDGDDIFVLDVREPYEFEICNIDKNLIPMGEIAARLSELDASKETIVYCRTGQRSAFIVEFLQSSGFENVHNLRGGIHAWSDDIDPSFPKY